MAGNRLRSPELALPLLWSLRPLPRTVWLALPAALLPLLACALFLANNEIAAVYRWGAARLAGGMAMTMLVATFAEALWKRRPVDRFMRSLPWSARRRVAYDGFFLFSITLPVVIVTTAMYPSAALVTLIVAGFLAVRASGHLRTALKLGPGSALWLEGALASGLVALVPWLSLPLLASLPLLWERAAERERNHTTVATGSGASATA